MDRANVEITIQIGAETDEEALSLMNDTILIAAEKLLQAKPEMAERFQIGQYERSAVHITLQRPNLEPSKGPESSE